MNFLLDPNIAYLLLVGGFLLAVLALFTPGTGILELGAFFMLALAGYSVASMPINAWALLLLVLGVFPFLLALRRWKQWYFLLVSIAALVAGSVFLFREPNGAPSVHPALAVVVSLVTTGFLWVVVRKGIEAIGLRPSHGMGDLVGRSGESRTRVHMEGTVYVGGENWSARSANPIPTGVPVRVMGREGFILVVEEIKPGQEPS